MFESQTYYYLVERKCDGKKFVVIGNFKLLWMGVSDLIDFVSYGYSQESPYGKISNVSNNVAYDKKRYRIVHQTLASKFKEEFTNVSN